MWCSTNVVLEYVESYNTIIIWRKWKIWYMEKWYKYVRWGKEQIY